MLRPNTTQFKNLFKDDAVWGEQEVIKFRWFLILIVLIFIGYIYISVDKSRALTSLLFASIYIFYNAAINFLLNKFGNATWIRYLSATFDISILSMHIFNYSYLYQPIAVVTAASTFLYPILILLSVLRYDGKLVIFTTCYTILCFNLIYFIRLPHIDPALISEIPSGNWAGQIYKSAYLIMMGYFMFSIPKMINRLVNKQLISLQRQSSVKLDLALEKQKKDLALLQLKKEKTLNQKLEEHQQTIEKQKKKLEEAIAIKDKLFSIIGHDLKSPFASQISILEVLMTDLDAFDCSDMKAILKSLKRSSNQGLDLLNNILEWSKQQHNLIEPKQQVINIYEAISNTLNLLQPHISHKKIQINLEVATHLSVIADINILKTILRNIISNAIKFSHAGDNIKISTRVGNHRISIDIVDTGIGMNESLVKQLFQPHSHISTPGTQNEPGTGLGLYLCKDLAKMIKAEIEVQSIEGKGSTFSVTFPTVNTCYN